MKTNDILRKALACFIALTACDITSTLVAQAELPDDFFSPMQKVYMSINDDCSNVFIRTIKTDDGKFFDICQTKDSLIYALLVQPPKGETKYSGKFIIPDYVTYVNIKNQQFEVPVVDISEYAFLESEIEELKLNHFIYSLGQECCLYTCDKLTKIFIPWESGIDFNDTRIGNSLKEITFGKGVSLSHRPFYSLFDRLDFSGRMVFFSSDSFDWLAAKHLILPSNVEVPAVDFEYKNRTLERLDFIGTEMPESGTLFGAESLSTIYSLKEMHCQWTTPPAIHENADSNPYDGKNTHVYDNCTVYVPEGYVDVYNNAPGWKKFKTILAETEGVNGVVTDRSVSSVECFDLLGYPVSSPTKGSVIIECTTFSDGSISIIKRLVR